MIDTAFSVHPESRQKSRSVFDPTADLAPAFGPPPATAVARARPEDFQVEEVLRFEPPGDGGHAYLRIRKRRLDTVAVAKALARHAAVPPVSVGFAGMKDRNAITTQWFSVDLSGRKEPDWSKLESDAVDVLEVTRGRKKLRPGQLDKNRFRIRLTSLSGDREAVNERLERISKQGVPNYFGPQRFGRNGDNLKAAKEMFAAGRKVRDRKLRGIYLSAARAQVFNRVLSERVASGNWNQALPGEVLMFGDSRSRFATDASEASTDPRIENLELHPTGPLWGKGSPDCAGEAAIVEREVAVSLSEFAEGLERAGLEADRRALRLRVDALEHQQCAEDDLNLFFALRPGAYATAVLRELARINDARKIQPG